jgi:hypothetical protein
MTGIMDGLGYAENRPGFAELARRVPLVVLQATARSAPASQQATLIADLLLGGSGLAGLDKPARAWVQFIGTLPMDPNAWKTSGVRPSNHPRRRIAALASYVGDARSVDIAINAVLPILVAEAQRRQDASTVVCLYQAYDTCSAPPPNTVVREALQLLHRPGRLTLGACDQQGLMRSYQCAVAPASA